MMMLLAQEPSLEAFNDWQTKLVTSINDFSAPETEAHYFFDKTLIQRQSLIKAEPEFPPIKPTTPRKSIEFPKPSEEKQKIKNEITELKNKLKNAELERDESQKRIALLAKGCDISAISGVPAISDKKKETRKYGQKIREIEALKKRIAELRELLAPYTWELRRTFA